jgi:hypothetical protein
MTTPFDTSLVTTVGIGALVAWRLYARIRRVIGRQRLSPLRPWVTVVVFPLLALLMLVLSIGHPLAAAALLAGAAIGVGLGLYGTRLTRFEVTPAGLFYTPNAHLGIALTLLLVLRLGYRYFASRLAGQAVDGDQLQMAQAGLSPLTLGLFGMLAGYYVTYAIGLIRWRAGVRAQA